MEATQDDRIVSDRQRYDAVRGIIADNNRLHALLWWHRQGGRPLNEFDTDHIVSGEESQILIGMLISTGWFEMDKGLLRPTAQGREFLHRAGELVRQTDLEASGDPAIPGLVELTRGTAVDIGCGVGYGLIHLARAGFHPLHGYDLSPLALTIAHAVLEREGFEAQWHAGDATLLSEIEDGEVAVIYSRIALYYFDVTRLASTFRRVLRPGGRVVAEVKGWQYYMQALGDLKRGRYRRAIGYGLVGVRTALYQLTGVQPLLGASAPEIGWSPATVRRLADKAGLEVCSCRYDSSHKSLHFILRKA